jgi:hypothetical protein
MNLTDIDSTVQIDAKLCGSLHTRRIAYSVVEFHHSLYINKKDIILGQISTCELLYQYAIGALDRNVLRKEILDSKLMLDLIE